MKKRVLSLLLTLSLLLALSAVGSPALAAGQKEINIFGIGDFGGALDDSGTPAGNPGGVRIVGAMKELTANAANPIVVAGGTSYTGNAISEVNHGTSVNDMYKAMGVQYVNIGNHDFDWSTAETRTTCFETWEEEGGFTFLNANVRTTDTNEQIFTPYAVQEVDGVKIGFFGVIDEGNFGVISSFNTEGIQFTAALDESLEAIKTLRNEEKCDVIIAMPHIASAQAKPDVETPVGEGALTEYITNLNKACKDAGVKSIDAAFASQCTTAHCAVVDGVPLVKAMNYGKIIAQLNIVVDGDDVTVTPSLHPLTQITVTEGEEKVSVLGSDETTRENVPEDAEFKEVYDEYNAALAELMDATRGTADAAFSWAEGADRFAYQKWYLRQNLYYINEVYGEPTVAYFQNTGGIRNIGDTAVKEGDPIALRFLYTVAPFDNYIVTMDMTGKDIKTLLAGESEYGTYASLLQYGLDVTYASGEYETNGEVVSMKLNGEELADDEVYHIACNSFLYPGPGDNMDFSAGTNAKNINVINRNAVLEALLHQSAALKDADETIWVSSDTASYTPEASNAQATVSGSADLITGANQVSVTVTSPYENPYTTPGTVSNTYTLNVVREYADQAEIPEEALEAVKALTAKGVFHGNENGCFAAGDALNARELAVILARAAGAELEADPADWAAPALAWCAANGAELQADAGVTPEVFQAAVKALFGECPAEFSPAVTRGEAAAALVQAMA